MIFTKTDIKKNTGTTTTIINSYIGGGSASTSVDLSDVYNKIDDNAKDIQQNVNDIKTLKGQINRLDEKYLRKDISDNNEDNILSLGGVLTNSVMTTKYGQYRGVALGKVGEDDWQVIVRGVANNIDKTTELADKIGDTVLYDKSSTSESTTIWGNSFTIDNTIKGATALVKAGFTKSSGITIISEQLSYSVGKYEEPATKAKVNSDTNIGFTVDAIKKSGDEWEIPLEVDGKYLYTLYYTVTYNVTYNNVQQSIKLYIKGTIGDGTTRYYGGAYCQTVVTNRDVTITKDNSGIKITADGIYKLTGDTQTKLL